MDATSADPAGVSSAAAASRGGTQASAVPTHVEEALRRAEEQLRQAQKMEAIGRLAAGVAHDFNNLLTVITGCADLIESGLAESDPLRPSASAILQAAGQATSLVRQLLAFSRRQPLHAEPLDLNTVLTEQRPVLDRLAGKALIAWRSASGLWPVLGDAAQLGQVLLNLVVNARDAVFDRGRITVETANVTVTAAEAAYRPALVPGPYVRLTVSDTGSGMDQTTLARVFEPFFTTKPAGTGTGLGLSTVYGVVKAHGGFVYADSIPERGSVFTVYLPPAEEDWPRGSETVLLVETGDEDREFARRVLQYGGYTALTARDPAEALHLFGQHRRQIRLLVAGLEQGTQTGPQLAELLRRQEPGLKALYLGGRAEDSPDLLPRPFTPRALARRVRGVLDA